MILKEGEKVELNASPKLLLERAEVVGERAELAEDVNVLLDDRVVGLVTRESKDRAHLHHRHAGGSEGVEAPQAQKVVLVDKMAEEVRIALRLAVLADADGRLRPDLAQTTDAVPTERLAKLLPHLVVGLEEVARVCVVAAERETLVVQLHVVVELC